MVMLSQLFHCVVCVDGFNGLDRVLVGVEALGLVGVEESLGKGVLGDILIGFVGPECHLNWLHEADVDEVLVLDLLHEVVDHIIHISLHLI